MRDLPEKLDIIILRDREIPTPDIVAGQTAFDGLEQELAFKLMTTKHFENDDVWLESTTAELATLYLEPNRKKAKRGQAGYDAVGVDFHGVEDRISVKARSLRSIRRTGRGGKLGYNPNCDSVEFFISGHNFTIRVASVKTSELLDESVAESDSRYWKNMKCMPRKVFGDLFEQACDLAEVLDGLTMDEAIADVDTKEKLMGHRVHLVSAG